ncbi:MAG: alpha/beta hydrolase [Mycobacteriaceae bacterium]
MQKIASRALISLVATLLTLPGITLLGSGTAQASSEIVSIYSPSMKKYISAEILFAAGDGPAPTLYLLDGLRAPDDDSGWLINTDVKRFFADKHVNVVVPFGGAGTFYTDWQKDDPTLGHVRWETFLTQELPAVMQQKYGSDGVNNAVAGLSMSGTSALNLAIHHPNFYKAVASFSGYPTASSPGFAQGIAVSVAQIGGDADNMWGSWPSMDWIRNDPALNAAELRGKGVYISSGAGGPNGDPALTPGSRSFDPVRFVQMVPLETAAGISSELFVASLLANGIRPQVDITPQGVHWWNYWQDNLHKAWFGTIAPALGV